MPRYQWLLSGLMSVLILTGCEAGTAPAGSATQTTSTAPADESTMPAEDSTGVDSEALALNTPQTEKKTEEQKEASKPKSWTKAGTVLQVASWEEVQKRISEQKGKVVVLDIWSSWCLPCVRELPGLIELQKKYPDQVVCISLNVNYNGSSPPEEEAEEVLEQLAKLGAITTNFMSSTADETLYEKLELASIPVAYVYQTDGSLKKRFDNESQAYGEEGFTYKDHITPLVDELLKK